MKKSISLILAMVMMFGLLPQMVLLADAEEATSVKNELAGKTISVLGASISTYAGTSNGSAADTTNSTIRNNVKYYPNTTIPEVALNDTWWMQVTKDLGLRLLVNNAWSGSAILLERSGTVGAYVDRCIQLHDNTGDNAGEEPDIICIQMGFNDFSYGKNTLGTADIDYNALITADGYGTPTTTMEATAIMLDKMVKRYPNAEIYMFNHFKRIGQSASETTLMENLNASIATVCARYDVTVVDLYTALTEPGHIGDGRLHPNRLGMDTISEAVKEAIIAHTDYAVETHTVTLNLNDVTANYVDNKIVVAGDAFSVELNAADELKVTVTMGGKDITESAYAGGKVTIGAVTADVTITAESVHNPKDYRWEFNGTDLVCVSGDNTLTKNAGTTTNGVFNKTRYALENAVVLLHDLPWSVEWKSEGTFKNTNGSSGARVFTSDDVNANYNARYIFKSATNWLIAMGEKDTKGSHNYGIALGDYGIDGSASHTYRLENRIAADGSNMIYLFVDGEEIGPMNHYYVGTVHQNTTSDWLSGKDFIFPYMGTDTHGFTNASIDYIQVCESDARSEHSHNYQKLMTAPTYTKGGYTTYTCPCGDSYTSDYTNPLSPNNYRWEFDGTDLACVSGDNTLTKNGGSTTNGVFTKTRYALENAVVLQHDLPWSVEWKSEGTFQNTNGSSGARVFTSDDVNANYNARYIFKSNTNGLIAMGEKNANGSHNYGIALGDYDIDWTQLHTYRLENRIADDGSNMIWLYVDDTEIGPMNNYFIGTNTQKTVSNWLSGKDFTFPYMGTDTHGFTNASINFIQVWEGGVPEASGPVITQQPVDGEAKLGEHYMVEVKDNTYDDVMTEARAGREVYCVITDANGNSVTTDTVKLICLPSEELAIITQPTDGEAVMGERFCVTVEAKGENLKYQWYFRNKGTEKWTKSGVTDNTYDDVMTTTRDGREVYCVITDLAGNKVTTDTVKLVRIPMKLEIVSQPTDAEAVFGEMFCVTVEAKGEGLKYQWYYRNAGSEEWHTSGVRDNTYDDEMTKARAGREIYCVITDQWGNTITSDTAMLIAVPSVELKILSQSYESAVMGERYCVTVEAQGEGLTYQWYGRNAGSDSWFKSSVTDNTYDDVMNKSRANREVYCVITDACGNTLTTDVVKLIPEEENSPEVVEEIAEEEEAEVTETTQPTDTEPVVETEPVAETEPTA